MPVHHPRRVLVTGGAGFIGTNLLHYLVPRWTDASFVNLDAVTYAGRPSNLRSLETSGRYRFEQGDIADRERVAALFDEHGFTTVLHLAAESHVDRSILDPLAFVRTNVLGTAVLLDVARGAWQSADGSFGDVRFHHVSTDEVFGSLGDTGMFDETTPYDPRSPYAASKAGSDHLVRAFVNTYRFPAVLSNCSNNYGPYQYPEKLIPLVILNAFHGREVPVYGTGSNVRDWLHVEDHCSAIERIVTTAPTGSTYLVSGGEERSNLELVGLLLDLVDDRLGRSRGTSRRLIRFVLDRPGHDFRYAIDGSRLVADLAWSPTRSLERGLGETVDWYLANLGWLDDPQDESYRAWVRTLYADRPSA